MSARPPPAPPPPAVPVLLHCCCAPCSGGVIETLIAEAVPVTVLFYNPNIQPRDEYLRRKNDLAGFCCRSEVAFIDLDEGEEAWHAATAGLEDEGERGRRCARCFALRLHRAARYAVAHGFPALATTGGISRFKDLAQVDAAGHAAAAAVDGVVYWARNWRKRGGAPAMDTVARREGFYRQRYCGCLPSRTARAGGRDSDPG